MIKKWLAHFPRHRPFTTKVQQHDEPLRILFCGSDDFSITALRAIHRYSKEPKGNILSIDVVSRTDKLSGRGLKNLKSPLIKSAAEELRLPFHQINTFTGWNPPSFSSSAIPYPNLIIAVSFGLLIPARLINMARFGGLNVHPSLLPDLRGAAPLNWAIIRGYSHTGVSVQTLHPTKFDEGVILAQTKPIPIPIDSDIDELRGQLAPIGADLLVKSLQSKLYLKPHASTIQSQLALRALAPKITPELKILDPLKDGLALILRKSLAIPRLFAYATSAKSDGRKERLRLVFPSQLRKCQPGEVPPAVINTMEKGLPFTWTSIGQDPSQRPTPIYIVCKNNDCLAVPRLLVAGRKEAPASQAAAGSKLYGRALRAGQYDIHPFLEPLSSVPD